MGNVPEIMSRWPKTAELALREMRRQAIFNINAHGSETVGMRNMVLKSTPLSTCRSVVAVLSPVWGAGYRMSLYGGSLGKVESQHAHQGNMGHC